ncbi:MAG: rod shape-determining protein MreD [Coriobacteriia bacterium]|nr:rod shape-determining protein MreD [Coriobacteriia bacterium]
MPQNSPHRLNVIGCLLVLVLQAGLAPHIAIMSVVPDLSMCFCIVIAMRTKPEAACIYAFFMGLFSDLIATGPLGASAIVFAVITYIVARLAPGMFCESYGGRVFTAIGAVIVGQILFAVVYSIIGTVDNVYYSLVMRVLPGAVYNALIVVVFSLLFRKSHGKTSSATSLKDRLPKI